jgi:hypothetical protein
MKTQALLLSMAIISLSGCVSRPQADEKLARGCAAGIELFMEEGFKIGSIKKTTFSESSEEGKEYRDVNIQYVETDGWANVDKQARCTFAEQFGLFGATYNASIYQISVNDQVYGKKGTEILGTYEQILKLTETVDNALNNFK